MVRTFLNLQRIDVGFRPERAMTLRLSLPEKYKPEDLPQAARELLGRLASVPGVEHAALGTDPPFNGGSSAIIVSPEGTDPGEANRGIRVYHHSVMPGFFDALGASVLKGRDFDDHDTRGAQPVIIVSRRFAAKAWPGADPIGRRLFVGRGTSRDWITVVGLVGDLPFQSRLDFQQRRRDIGRIGARGGRLPLLRKRRCRQRGRSEKPKAERAQIGHETPSFRPNGVLRQSRYSLSTIVTVRD